MWRCNVTSPSLRPEDSCGPCRMMNGRLCVQVEQLCAECSGKCSFTTRKLRWVSLTVCSLVLRPGTYGPWECSFLIWRLMSADIMLLIYYGIPKESCSTSTALYWKISGSAPLMLKKTSLLQAASSAHLPVPVAFKHTLQFVCRNREWILIMITSLFFYLVILREKQSSSTQREINSREAKLWVFFIYLFILKIVEAPFLSYLEVFQLWGLEDLSKSGGRARLFGTFCSRIQDVVGLCSSCDNLI